MLRRNRWQRGSEWPRRSWPGGCHQAKEELWRAAELLGLADLPLGLGCFLGFLPLLAPGGSFYEGWEEVPLAERKPKGQICQSMFPSELSERAGERCIRLSLGRHLCALTDHNPLPARACTLQILQQLRNPHEIDGSGFFVAVFTKTLHRAFPLEIPRQPSLGSQIPWRARPGHTEVPAHPFPPYRQEPEQLLRPRLARKPRCPVDCHLDSSSGCKAV